MPRIRSVHPDICTDEVMAGLSAEHERLFVRLWTHLDDEGRCVDNPLLIKAALFPLSEGISAMDVDGWLHCLAKASLIHRYEVGGRRYLTAKPGAWGRWQKPRRKVESKLPPAPACADNVPPMTDIRPQCPTGGGDVGGEGEETETKKEGESEGEPPVARLTSWPVDKANPLHRRIEALPTLYALPQEPHHA
jgi:hypothetical protein